MNCRLLQSLANNLQTSMCILKEKVLKHLFTNFGKIIINLINARHYMNFFEKRKKKSFFWRSQKLKIAVARRMRQLLIETSTQHNIAQEICMKYSDCLPPLKPGQQQKLPTQKTFHLGPGSNIIVIQLNIFWIALEFTLNSMQIPNFDDVMSVCLVKISSYAPHHYANYTLIYTICF